MTTPTASRRRPWARWLMLALLVVPVVEVFIIIKVGQSIGGLNTLALLIVWSAIGAWIVKRESGRAFGALRQAFSSGRMPAHELSDTALVLIGGTLLLAPGFLTDAIGLFFLLPFTRPLTRRLLEGAVAARLFGGFAPARATAGPRLFGAASASRDEAQASTNPYPTSTSFADRGASAWNTGAHRAAGAGRGDVIEGEIID